MSRIECHFLMPLERNSDRKPHRLRTWEWLRDELREKLGDFTGPEGIIVYRNEAPVAGLGRDQHGRPVEDLSHKYFLALPKSAVPTLREVLQDALGRFDQDMIYVNVAGRVEFVTLPPGQVA